MLHRLFASALACTTVRLRCCGFGAATAWRGGAADAWRGDAAGGGGRSGVEVEQ
tara:strand:+ start:249 stop:410 length:162 start_codon:yes stop_codon:yes gene_type:complete